MNKGFTVLEVLVATAVMAIGGMALVLLQARALAISRHLRGVATLVELGEQELQRQRQLRRTAFSGTCLSMTSELHARGYRCRVTRSPCRITSIQVDCRSSGEDNGELVEVVVERLEGDSLLLRTVVGRRHPFAPFI